MSLGLLDQQHTQRWLLVAGVVGDRGEKDGHVEQVVVAETVLVHVERGDLSDLRAQGPDDTLEARVVERQVAVWRELAAARHSIQPSGDMRPGLHDRVDGVERLVRGLRRGDDRVPIGMAGWR
jgi:hypothetical protein